MSELGIRKTYEGLRSAECWGWYDENYDACKNICKVAQFCKPAAARREARTPPVSLPPPPKAEVVEATLKPSPMEYFKGMLPTIGTIKANKKLSSDKAYTSDIYDVNGNLYARVLIQKNGNKVQIQSSKGKNIHVIDSIDDAEQVLATL